MYTKAIISNRFIEITQQSLAPLYSKTLSGGRKSTTTGMSENYNTNRKISINRARRDIRRLLECNFPSQYAFVTLTFGNKLDFDTTNIDICNKKFSDFKKRIVYFLKKNEYPELKYIGITEFQDNRGGAVHYHLICNLTKVSNGRLADLWKYGTVHRQEVKSNPLENEKISNYLKKGISDPRLAGKKKYLRSKSLKKPTKVVISDIEKLKRLLDSTGSVNLSFETYNSPLYGDINYQTYYTLNPKEIMNYAEEIK
ncbi:hypothetical protein CUC15_05670 [Oceanobacillus zhaokaii]|uniref:Replication-associated protein ORF2/G2P domain-containing protein n=1 Tax=Oceanobacillus zhaokaii TaxID=2052660 RepID=A0A345PEK6_9BACI|nr:hypothetical protein [Oceanobacillus zhaokaii]AXI08436.1 hypothetical protein CUC15_05670 [Oceanobacillus zhaokaii]